MTFGPLHPRPLVAHGLRALVVHRDLLCRFARRNLHLQLRGSVLGILWLVINPLFMMALYAFVFGTIFHGRYGGAAHESAADYALGIFVSLSVFQLFSDSMTAATTAITNNPNLVKKVVFPLEILPAATVGANCLQFAISLGLFMLGAIAFGEGIWINWLWLPALLLPVIGLSYGIALLFSAVGVFLRDLAQIARFLSSILLFSSAVFYGLNALPAAAQRVLALNPLAQALEAIRGVLMWGAAPSPLATAYLYAVSGLVLALGLIVFRRLSPDFADAL